MKYWILTLCYLCAGLCFSYGQYPYDGSKVSVASRRIVAKIAKENQLLGSAVSAAGVRTEQYNRFEKLTKTAATAELRELTNHPNGVVRGYAFWALALDTTVDLMPVLEAHINDTAMVLAQFGCIISLEKVGDVMINMINRPYIYTEHNRLDSLQLARLDSLLIHAPNKLDNTERLIYEALPTAALYPVMRKLVTEDHNLTALVPLSKYQNRQDVPLILASRDTRGSKEDGYYYTYEAISNFPHPAFFPLLERNLEQTWDETNYTNEWMMLYYAIASFKNEQACALMQRSLMVKSETMRAYHLRFITRAASTYRCPVYDSLLWALWINEKQLITNVYDYLKAKDPKRCLEAIKQTLLDTDAYTITQNYEDKEERTPDDMLKAMIDLVLQQDHTCGLELIGKNIRETNVHLFELFADKAADLKDPSLVEPLLERMTKEDNAHIYLKAATALLRYKDKSINTRIAVVKKETPDRYWGDDAFQILLKENDIR